MSNLDSVLHFFQAIKLRELSGLIFIGLPVAAHAAQSGEGAFAPDLNILMIRPGSGNYWLSPSWLKANVALARAEDSAPTGPGFGNASRLFPDCCKPQQKAAREITAHWQQPEDSARVSLPHLLRIDLEGEQARVAFRPGSILIGGKGTKVTFRSRSALIEGEGVKIMLQPRSASILWSWSLLR